MQHKFRWYAVIFVFVATVLFLMRVDCRVLVQKEMSYLGIFMMPFFTSLCIALGTRISYQFQKRDFYLCLRGSSDVGMNSNLKKFTALDMVISAVLLLCMVFIIPILTYHIVRWARPLCFDV